VTDIRRRFAEHGASSSYRMLESARGGIVAAAVPVRLPAGEGSGYRGWIVLFDEVELIGRYTIGQRAKSLRNRPLGTWRP